MRDRESENVVRGGHRRDAGATERRSTCAPKRGPNAGKPGCPNAGKRASVVE